MSRNDWEAGSIKIPTRAWSPLKKALAEAHNQHRERIQNRAERIQKTLEATFKGKRNVKPLDAQREIERALDYCPEECFEAVEALVKASLKKGSCWRSNKITQAMLDTHFAPKATNRTLRYEGSEWGITLDDTAHTVHWCVIENNHAVERARESHMGNALFRLLTRIDYGKRKDMGGQIVGNDENNRHDNEADGGANYVTARFGKAGESEFGSRLRPRRTRRYA